MPKAVGYLTRCTWTGERARRSAPAPPPAPPEPAAAAWQAAAREVVRLHGAPLTHLLAVGRALVSASADGVLLVSLLGAGAGAGAPGGPAGAPTDARPRGLCPPRGSAALWAACARAPVSVDPPALRLAASEAARCRGDSPRRRRRFRLAGPERTGVSQPLTMQTWQTAVYVAYHCDQPWHASERERARPVAQRWRWRVGRSRARRSRRLRCAWFARATSMRARRSPRRPQLICAPRARRRSLRGGARPCHCWRGCARRLRPPMPSAARPSPPPPPPRRCPANLF